MGRIKVGDIEGAKDDVIGFIKETGIDTWSFLHAPKPIKASLGWLILFVLAFVAVLSSILYISDKRIATIIALISIALAAIITSLVYMYWKNKILAGIITLFEVAMFAVATGVYTFSDIVKKVEHHIERNK